MSADLWSGIVRAVPLMAGLIGAHRPLGAYMAKAYTSEKDWRAERWL